MCGTKCSSKSCSLPYRREERGLNESFSFLFFFFFFFKKPFIYIIVTVVDDDVVAVVLTVVHRRSDIVLVAVVDVVVLSIRVFISRWCERYLSFLSFARRTRSYPCSVTVPA